MPKTYVDNAYNRSVGRVGMPVGSAVISRSGGGSSYGGWGGGGSSYSLGGGSSYSSGGSSKTYVDNAYNRSLGRVGMEHGSMVASRSGNTGSCGSSGSTKTYVDNSYNRSLGRVGMEHGTAVVSQSDTSRNSSGGAKPKTYVDNAMNRSLGRVGMEHGTMPSSRSSGSYEYVDSPVRVYTDNAFNRKLGRVGKPLGSVPVSRSGYSSRDSGISSPTIRKYVDNSLNRSLGRVGHPIGTMPLSKVSRRTEMMLDMYKYLQRNEGEDMDWECSYPDVPEEMQLQIYDDVLNRYNRHQQIQEWKAQHYTKEEPKTSRKLLKDYSGTKINFEELQLGKKIGQGGFGDVHFAKWSGSVVAVKKLRVQRVSKKRLQEFTDEIFVLCQLEHPNIVKFIGACVKTPNLCIVMEYMQTSLFDAVHIDDDKDFTEEERLDIIKQTAAGILYLHSNNIAHCDMKSHNVLLDYEPGELLIAKITDFGLSMMKQESDTSSSTGHEYVRNIGTPRYSAPEILRGEVLELRAMKKADIYSFSLIIYEVICEEEPFYKMNYRQLQTQVGEKGLIPSVPEQINLKTSLHRQLMECWSRSGDQRPSARELYDFFGDINKIYSS
ncbi:hypothetical protein FSP39_020785 [Pinctada imbricata]|uniref:non-specific serine/threonine protein kinase n=1 Tax=Pinctada imbricata TaxID=66713 RepID=A0AA88YEE7_PINIB|nr:hypothetical protein FSP39_020785 [Pinctada imbricata]